MEVKILRHHRWNYYFIFLVILLHLLIKIIPIWGHEDPSSSFKDLEEDEWISRPHLTEIMEIEREMTRCCTREKKMKSIGTAVSGDELIIDVGHCRKKCPPQKPLKKKKFEKLMMENPNIDPRELFLIHSTRLTKRRPSCPKGESCSESDYRIEKVLTSEGELTVDIVENCSCQQNSKSCKRHQKIVTFHKGTPLESTVDVGECRGHCQEDMKCQPVVTKTTSVNGPNGAECVSLIEDCLCSSHCYRISHYEQVYDHSTDSPVIKVIDIGKCVGECPKERKLHCILRKEDNDSCLMGLKENSSECLPSSFHNYEFTEKNGSLRNITSISSCGCH